MFLVVEVADTLWCVCGRWQSGWSEHGATVEGPNHDTLPRRVIMATLPRQV